MHLNDSINQSRKVQRTSEKQSKRYSSLDTASALHVQQITIGMRIRVALCMHLETDDVEDIVWTFVWLGKGVQVCLCAIAAPVLACIKVLIEF